MEAKVWNHATARCGVLLAGAGGAGAGSRARRVGPLGGATAERLMVQLGLGTGRARLAAIGVGVREGAERLSGSVRSARSLPERVTSGLPHVHGDLAQYEHMAEHPGALARWRERTEPDCRRYLVLGGHPAPMDLARREFVGNVPLATVDLGGAVPWPDRERAQKALAVALGRCRGVLRQPDEAGDAAAGAAGAHRRCAAAVGVYWAVGGVTRPRTATQVGGYAQRTSVALS